MHNYFKTEYMIVNTEKMIYGGDCLVRHSDDLGDKIIFVPFALPEETLDVSIVHEKKHFIYTQIEKIITPSPHRIKALCPLFANCGGCNMQYIDYEYQKTLKKEIVLEVFARAKVVIPPITFQGSSPWEYRSRFQFHRTPSFMHTHTRTPALSKSPTVGLKARSDRQIIPIQDCPVADVEIRTALKNDFFTCQTAHTNAYQERFNVIGSKTVLGGTPPFEHIIRQDMPPENGTYSITLCGKTLYADIHGFFQSNLSLLEKLITDLIQNITLQHTTKNTMRALDLYCGVGTFSVFLADIFDEVIAVEEHRSSAHYAKKNLKNTKTSHIVYSGSVESWIKQADSKKYFDIIVLDPPRTGLDSQTTQYLIGKKVKTLYYISCDPVTLARDASLLCANGYTITHMTAYDFYPHTNHIESLVVFTSQM